MGSIEVLGTYLNDHLGGANAGVQMARQLQERVRGCSEEAVLDVLVTDIEEDRDVLRSLVDELEQAGHPVKKAVGWVGGKAHELAIGELLTGDEHLSVLLAAETLALGIEGKSALWTSLIAVSTAYPQLAAVDLPRLADRARDQRRRIEAVRIGAARRAFTTPH